MRMDGDESSNIEDRRGEGGGFGGGGFGGGGFPIPMGGGGGGLFKGGFGLVAFVVIAMIMGADPGAILSDIAGGGTSSSDRTSAASTRPSASKVETVSTSEMQCAVPPSTSRCTASSRLIIGARAPPLGCTVVMAKGAHGANAWAASEHVACRYECLDPLDVRR